MVNLDEGALICDFAEVYHVLDWRSLPVLTAATLAMGLGPNSRIMKKISGTSVDADTLLLAMIADALHVLIWQNTKDGVKGRNRPKRIMQTILGGDQDKETESFDSVEDFRNWHATMTGGKTNE